MNALKHISLGATPAKIAPLAHELAFGSPEPILRAAAVAAAEAQLELERVQDAKVALINRDAVEDLYLAPTERKFRSRHSLKLYYRSQRHGVVQRYRARVDKIMKSVGASVFDVPFLRPKYMRRKTFAWLSLELQKQVARMYAVIAGAPQPDFGDDDEEAT
jgi:hypothetical protein